HGAAVIALQHPALAQVIEILAYCLRGDVEAVGQRLHADAALRLRQRHDVGLSRGEHVHPATLRILRFISIFRSGQAPDAKSTSTARRSALTAAEMGRTHRHFAETSCRNGGL